MSGSLQYFEGRLDLAGTQLPVRSTLVTLRTARVLISPIRFSEVQWGQLRSQGGVTDILAPSMLHHLFVRPAFEAFPGARLWAAPGLERKRPKVPWTQVLAASGWPYQDELPLHVLEGAPQTNEVVFFHKSSRTLIVVDLCFNLVNPRGWAAPLMLGLFGTYGRFACSRLLHYYVRDKVAFKRSLEPIFDWDFDRIVMGHGEVLETGGKERLMAALRERGF